MQTKTAPKAPRRIRKIFADILRYPTVADFHSDPEWAQRENAVSNEDGARPDPPARSVSLKEAVLDLGHRIAATPAIGDGGSDLD